VYDIVIGSSERLIVYEEGPQDIDMVKEWVIADPPLACRVIVTAVFELVDLSLEPLYLIF